MERKDFLKNGVWGFATVLTGIGFAGDNKNGNKVAGDDCDVSPRETRGPFPTKTPAQMVQSNIKSDRDGIALLINFTILDKTNNCKPLAGAHVDIWHCDKDGNYSEYGNHPMQRTDLISVHFLRGRQTTDENGHISFLSIYPGWYHGRAPHIHIEIFDTAGKSVLVTQVAFPENISKNVYSSPLYAARGEADTPNNRDNVFADSLSEQMATVTGNVKDGFTLTSTIVVKS
ncbi:MAG TPA: intradiol ring-cleavage dioxygenase [Chitinophagaceae bacterium]|nr:intradiol ring-cleavage dioxygenase [Chitinophagaceae bacterium]